jgi:protein-disulfide isomerase
MNAQQHQQPGAANPAPTLSLVGVPFSYMVHAEPEASVRGSVYATLWTAIRPNEVWKIDWNGPASRIELSFNNSLVWESPVASGAGPLRDLVAFQSVVDQFVAPPPAAAGPPQPHLLGRASRWVISQVNTPRAVLRTSVRLVCGFLMFMGAVLLFTMIYQWNARQALAASVRADTSASAAPAAKVPPELRDRTLGETLSATEMQVVANATRELGIQMRPSGQPFVIFSDPNCPSCKDLEPKLSQVDPRFVPVIVPVSFKDGSEDAVKRVLCAKDTVSAWSAAIGGYTPVGDAVSDGTCAGAADKVLKANGAFVALNFTGTPTLVSATGKVVAGSGSLDDINKWLVANGGLKADAATATR